MLVCGVICVHVGGEGLLQIVPSYARVLGGGSGTVTGFGFGCWADGGLAKSFMAGPNVRWCRYCRRKHRS